MSSSSSYRSFPYEPRPPGNWESLKQEMNDAKLLLVSQQGPAVFIVQDENFSSFKVLLGDPHTCSCSSPAATSSGAGAGIGNTAGALCAHKLYCILKIKRVPDTHPLAWQKCYTDSELAQVSDG
jgi:hypothetical protein